MNRSRRARRPAALLAALLVTGAAQLASAEAGNVRYSYEKVEIGPQSGWVLVPHPEASIATGKRGPTKSTLLSAFDALKRAKGSSYGKASVRVSGGATPASAQIEVAIDRSPNFAKFAPIVIAEVTYTMTELGAPGVSFPGFADGLVTRADVPFPAYSLSVPMWQALPPADVAPAQVTLADGSSLDARTFYERWKKRDAALTRSLLAYLESGNPTTAVLVLRRLGDLKGIDAAASILAMLDAPSALVRREAVAALKGARDDAAVSKAVAARLAKESDPETGAQMAAFFDGAKSAEYAVLAPMYTLANDKDAARAAAAAGQLARYKSDARVAPALLARLGDARRPVAEAAAASLTAIGADGARTEALADASIPAGVRLDVARGMAQGENDAAAVAGLVYLGQSAPGPEADAAIASLGAKKGDAAREGAERFLVDANPARRRAAAAALGARRDPGAVAALAAALEKNPLDRELETAALSIYAAQPIGAIADAASTGPAAARRLAYVALGRKASGGGDAKTKAAIGAGLKDESASIRGAAARALAASGQAGAGAQLKPLVEDRDAGVRADVALAIGALKGGELGAELGSMLKDRSSVVQAAAVEAMAARGEAGEWKTIENYTKASDEKLRAAALAALAALVDRNDAQTTQQVVSTLGVALRDKSAGVRRRAIAALGTFPSQGAVLSLASVLSDADADIRAAALRALGQTGVKSASDTVAARLSDPDPGVRVAAAEAIAALNDPKAKKKLRQSLAGESDPTVKRLMQKALGNS